MRLPEPVGDQPQSAAIAALASDPERANRELRALLTAEQQDAHDALGVGDLPIFAHFDVRLEPIREIDQLGGGSRVQAQPIGHFDGGGQRSAHEPARCASRCATTTSCSSPSWRPSSSAIATDRCLPPVQPSATVR